VSVGSLFLFIFSLETQRVEAANLTVIARGSFLGMVVKILYPDLDIEFSITFKEVGSRFMCFCNDITLVKKIMTSLQRNLMSFYIMHKDETMD
jgi:hypothetical protein